MWLEQTIWIWAPLASAALIWMTSRLAALSREVRNLRTRLDQLEDADARPAHQVNTKNHTRRAA
jgi:hypothetical protein